MEECYHQCSNKVIEMRQMLKQISSNDTMRLVCRDTDALVIEILENSSESINSKSKHKSMQMAKLEAKTELYMISIQESNSRSSSSQRQVYIVS